MLADKFALDLRWFGLQRGIASASSNENKLIFPTKSLAGFARISLVGKVCRRTAPAGGPMNTIPSRGAVRPASGSPILATAKTYSPAAAKCASVRLLLTPMR